MSYFKNAKVGSYYDFVQEVSFEVRSSKDPYLAFKDAKANGGTDFKLFLVLAVACLIAAGIASVVIGSYFCCYLQRSGPHDRPPTHTRRNRRGELELEEQAKMQLKNVLK